MTAKIALIPLFVVASCSQDIEVSPSWVYLACIEDSECTGVIVSDICNRARGVTCSDIPLQTSDLSDYEAAYRDARDSCLFDPPRGGDGVVCVETYVCVNQKCTIEEFQSVADQGE
jgi:hypothetical protein